MNEFLKNITGELTTAQFAAAFFFSLVGIFLSLLLDTTKRDPVSRRSPLRFSWDFFWCDNSLRIYKSIITTLLLVFIGIRFSKELFGVELTMFFALLIGLGTDKVYERLKNKTNNQPPTQ